MDKQKTIKNEDIGEETTDIKERILNHIKAYDDAFEKKRGLYDEYEDILFNRLGDSISNRTKSNVFDPILSTLVMERSARVMAQVPTGKIKAVSKNDEGASRLMNLTLDKYIIPNANAQFDFLTKCRMVDLYSNVYGSFCVLVDWDIKPNGIASPDIFLIPVRDVIYQIGVAFEDQTAVAIRTWQGIEFFEDLKDREGYKNIDEILVKLKDKNGSRDNRDSDQISRREQDQYPAGQQAAKGQGKFEIISYYEADRWIDFCVDAELEFRDRDNPHDNGELPLVQKVSVPLIDDIMGMGDFERGKTMQYTVNSLWNLYLDGVKVSIFPPVLLDKNAIADTNSIKWSAAAKWLMKGNPATGAQVMNLTPQGTQTFNNVLGLGKASLMSQFGTSDTAITQDTDPGFGKTPQALKMQAARENARDSVDRFYMEQFMVKIIKKMVNLMAKMGDKVQIRMFEEEISELAKVYPDIKEMWDEGSGKLQIDKSKTGSIIYDYEIVSGSTFAVDQENQQKNLIGLFTQLTQELQADPQTGEVTSPLLQAFKKENKTIKLTEMFTRIVSSSGIQDWDKFIVDRNDDPDAIMEEDQNKFLKIIQSMNAAPGGEMGGSPSEQMVLKQQEGAPGNGEQQGFPGSATQLLQ